MKATILIIFFAITTSLYAQNLELSSPYIGNWYNSRTNEWNYGLFEKFAIIDGKVAYYKEIKKTKTGLNIFFDKRSVFKPLQVRLENDRLHIGKENYHKVEKHLPTYSTSDTTSFYDSHYQKIDTAYVSGYLRGNTSKNPFRISIENWLTGESEDFYSDVDENGLFTVKVPLINTSQAYIDWGRSTIISVLTPGEQYFLFKDLQTGEELWAGTNVRVNNEISKYSRFVSINNIRLKTNEEEQKRYNYLNSLKDTVFLYEKLHELDTLQKIDYAFISNNNLSSKTFYYITNKTKLKIGFYLMQKKFQLDRTTNEKFSDKYMEIVKRDFFAHKIHPATLIRDNYTFIEDYSRYMDDQINGENSVVYSTAFYAILKNGLIKSNLEIIEYAKWIDLKSKGLIGQTDSAQANLILNDIELERKYEEIYNNNERYISKYVNFELFVINPAKRYQAILENPQYDLIMTNTFLSFFDQNLEALDDNLLNHGLKNIQNPLFKSIITTKNNELRELSNKKLNFANNFKNTDHLKEAKDADLLLKEILAPFKDKVVYVDFWGTWCGPCIAEMEYVPKAKELLKDKDVIFLYFANSTPQTSLENFVKSKNIEGPNVIHYNLPQQQQSMIERRLSVNSFPTYMLFDKKGELANNKAPRPSDIENLLKEIDKLLED